MKMHNLISTFALMAALPLAAYANDDDTKFVEKATQATQFEIQSSKLALEKSQNAEVKKFAQQMIDDHTKNGNQLKKTLTKSTVTKAAPNALDSEHQQIIDKLEATTGKDFDEGYVDAQKDAHEDAVDLFKDYSKDGKDQALKDFAAKSLPELEEHLNEVKKLDSSL